MQIELNDKVFNKFKNIKNGTYVEAGAFDGVFQSNTYRLEKERDWTGVLIEPSMNRFNQCVKNRSKSNVFVNAAIVSSEYDKNKIFGDFNGEPVSSVGAMRCSKYRNSLNEVNAVTAQSIFDKHDIRSIDLFSLDVEGYELEALKGIDFDKMSIENFLIEIRNKDKNDIISFLTSKGYGIPINFSDFNTQTHPNWSGDHNDYLFEKIK